MKMGTLEQQVAFVKLKKQLVSALLIVHHSSSLPLTLACNVNAYGVGAVISHIMPDGSKKPIAYASPTFSKTELNYSQIEKEPLRLVFGVKKCHQYLCGRFVTLVNNHKPLTSIFGTEDGISTLAPARMQHWALLLSAYHYDREFRPTLQHASADCLSRLPVSNDAGFSGKDFEATTLNLIQIQVLPVKVEHIAEAMRTDPVLSHVSVFTCTHWPAQVPDHLQPYFARCNELTMEENRLLWLIRVTVPLKLQHHVLDELHLSHLGFVRMKSLASHSRLVAQH